MKDCIVGIGHDYSDHTQTNELKSPISELAIYQGIVSEQAIQNAYNEGSNTSITHEGTKKEYDVNFAFTGSSDNWGQVGYWKMGNTGHVRSGAYVAGGFKDLSVSGSTNMLTSSVTVGGTVTENVQVPYEVSARTDGKDTLKLYAREGSSDAWELLTTKEIAHASSNAYRYLSDESGFSTSRKYAIRAPYNGYWVAVSSSSGYRDTTYYHVDNFEVIVSSYIL